MVKQDQIFQYDKAELRKIAGVIRKMGDEAKDQAKGVTGELVEYVLDRIKSAAGSHPRRKVAQRIADGGKVAKSSVVGEISFGFASQRFSGGGNTQYNERSKGGNGLLAGTEFGSNKYKQFIARTPRFGLKGNEGSFIYPTLRRIQPEVVRKWEDGFSKIVREWEV